jgi:hypothetical protein
MTKFKTTNKIILILFAILQSGGQLNASEAVVIDLPQFEPAISEIGEVFGIFKIVKEIEAKYNAVFEEKFKDVVNYPEMSLIDLGDEIIAIIDHATELPVEIRENIKKLINIKKVSNSYAEFMSPNRLINEILIQLANFKLDRINKGTDVLKKYFDMKDIAKITQIIMIYRSSVKKQMDRATTDPKNTKFKSIDDVKTDLKNIGDKINAILKEHELYTIFKTKCGSEEKPASLLGQAAEDMRMLKIFNYRVAQNKRHK